MNVSTILDDIDRGKLALPLFQRGYVWTGKDVKKLMRSLYLGYPVGGLLLWGTTADNAEIRSSGPTLDSGAIELLLDGQQRMTTLYGIIRGAPPTFFEGDPKAFTGLFFNLAGKDEEEDGEEFEFYQPLKMGLKPRWISVTDLFKRAPAEVVTELVTNNAYSTKQLQLYLERAYKIFNIKDTDFHIHSVTGADKTTDVVVEIFNAVNSGGRKLSKGDLALARIGSLWPEVRTEMKDRLDKWQTVGFMANRDWLLRCIAGVVTETAESERLGDRPVAEVQEALPLTEAAIDRLLEATRTHLGMDIDKAHRSPNAFPVMVKYLVNNGGDFPDNTAKAQLLHWYINASIWGRFSGSTETAINQDLAALNTIDPIETLRRNLTQSVGNRTVGPESFDFQNRGARFYTLFRIMSRVWGAKDWGTGQELSDHGPGTSIELHHIFPRKCLSDNGISASDANNFGNCAFQTRNTNQAIRDRAPKDYMPEITENRPGALESQWVPNCPELWKVENYQEFLAERRRLLAEAANEILEFLRTGNLPSAKGGAMLGSSENDEEAAILDEFNRFVVNAGLAEGSTGYEIVDENNGALIALLDLAWPNGLQDGFSERVAVLINEGASARIAANNAGFSSIFTNLEEFQHYVRREILGEDAEGA